jgi:hypothetical protein
LRNGAIADAPWLDLRCKPAERGADPFLALAYAIALARGDSGRPVAQLAADLRTAPTALDARVAELLVDRPANAEALLVIDQFEELFTQVDGDDRTRFLELLQQAAATPRLRTLTTLRVDFYARAAADPMLSQLMQGPGGTLPVGPPGQAALYEMIQRPAEVAGLELEEGLIGRILEDTGTSPGGLALMAFALNELYELGKADRRLTLAEYDAIGGVKGAIRIRAEDTYRRVGGRSHRQLDHLFEALIEVNEQEVAARRRATLSAVDREAADLVHAFVAARLLVTGTGADNEPTVEVAHEALLTAWPRLGKWIEKHADALRARRDLEHAAKEWEQAGSPASALRSGPVLRRYHQAARPSPLAQAYLRACRRRLWVRRTAAATLLGLAGAMAIFHLWSRAVGVPWGMAAELVLYRAGLYSPTWIPRVVALYPGDDGFPGAFAMGSTGETEMFRQERPRHDVRMQRPFAIGSHEVTFEQYDAYCRGQQTACPSDEGWGRDTRPVINVSWEETQAYLDWLRELTQKSFRLPTEAEWEYAARAGTDTLYWWGDDLSPGRANCVACGRPDQELGEAGKTMPVGAFPANRFGLYDTVGNVWEWVEDCWNGSYAGAPNDGSAWTEGRCSKRVLRGGSFKSPALSLRSAERRSAHTTSRLDDVGFRLAQDL